jgi:protein-S-isoprenylcysteine O-methyltransferase Ste14
VASTAAFALVLGRFFYARIIGEPFPPPLAAFFPAPVEGCLSEASLYLEVVTDGADEERHLVRFFGQDYINYRKRVGTGLPFPIPS